MSYYSNLGASTWPVVFRRTRGSSGDAFDVFRGVTVQSRTGLCRTKSLKTISRTSAHSSSLIKAQECCKSVCFTAYGATSLFPYAAAAAAAAAWTLWHCWTQHILSLLQMYQYMRPAEAVLHSTHCRVAHAISSRRPAGLFVPLSARLLFVVQNLFQTAALGSICLGFATYFQSRRLAHRCVSHGDVK